MAAFMVLFTVERHLHLLEALVWFLQFLMRAECSNRGP